MNFVVMEKDWEMMNNIIGKSQDKRIVISKNIVNNVESSNAQVIANRLVAHFATVGVTYASKITPSNTLITDYLKKNPNNDSSLFFRPTTEHEVNKLIDGLTNKMSTGWDGISNKILKHIKKPIIRPLTVIIKKSLEMGVFPDCMKLANVSPLHKGGREDYCTHYIPISLLPVLSKILEKVVYSRTYNFLSAKNQLFKSQYGFRKCHSCENAVQELLSNVLKGFERKEYTAAIFLDLSKAFDMLKHLIIAIKNSDLWYQRHNSFLV